MSYGKFLDEVCDLDFPKNNWKQNQAYLRDKWIEQKRFNELFSYIHENWDLGQWDDFFDPLEEYLIENKLVKLYIKFWKGILRHRLSDLWYSKKEYSTEHIIENQKFTLDGLYWFKKGLISLNAEEEIKKTEELIETVKKLERPKPKKTTDKRKIDEKVFWELIKLNREKSEDKFEFIENLTNQLEEFKPIEIRRFERFFLNKYNELNRWEIWALAYIIRRGCGDDAFDYFKAWVISKGQEAFEDIKSLNVSKLQRYFDEDPQLEEMFWLVENVYENKTGELMSPVRVKKQKLSGKEWKEDNLENEFPVIWKIFN